VAKTNAWLEPWFLNAKLAYHRAQEHQLHELILKTTLDLLSVHLELARVQADVHAIETRLQGVSRG
jgi:hypothetical protein